jgi:hypothetical protein
MDEVQARPSIVVVNCGSRFCRPSCSRQSYPVRQYAARPLRYSTGTPRLQPIPSGSAGHRVRASRSRRSSKAVPGDLDPEGVDPWVDALILERSELSIAAVALEGSELSIAIVTLGSAAFSLATSVSRPWVRSSLAI